MSHTVYVSPTLPWDPLPGESNRLRVLMAIMLLLALLIWIIVPLVHIPEVKRSEAEAVPERLARMVVQQRVVPPPPKPVEAAKPDEKLAKTEVKPADVEKAPKAVATDLQKSAAKARASKAIQEAGINDALADLRSMDVMAQAAPKGQPGQTGSGTGGNLITSTEEAGTSRNLLTSRAGAGSGAGNAYAGGVSSGFGGGKAGGKGSAGMMGAGVAGGSGKLQTVASGIGAGAAPRTVSKDGKMSRTKEDIYKVFDRNGGRLNNLFQRALRDDPTLQGAVSLSLSVSPEGIVTKCSIVSSQLNNPELETKMIALVKGFVFEAGSFEPWSGNIQYNFSAGG